MSAQLPPEAWRKSTFSQGNSNCPEWRYTPDYVELRETTEVELVGEENAQVLKIPYPAWNAFIRGIKLGEGDAGLEFDPRPVSDWRQVEKAAWLF